MQYFLALCVLFMIDRSTLSAASADDMFDLVAASPAAVGAHDRETWLNLFTADASIQDPVGSLILSRDPQAAEEDALSKFYSVFIETHEIAFLPYRDFIKGEEVLRDLTIETRMDVSCRLLVPAFLTYEVRETDEGLRIAALRAYWELSENALGIAKQAWNCSAASLALSERMLKVLGAPYALHYAGALNSVGELGKWQLKALQQAIAARDEKKIEDIFAKGARIECLDGGAAMSVRELWQLVREGRFRFELEDKILSAERSTLARAQLQSGDRSGPATLQATFGAFDSKIHSLKCFQALYPSH